MGNCKHCALTEYKSEDYINENFSNSSILKSIVWEKIEISIRKVCKITRLNSNYIEEKKFKYIINSLFHNNHNKWSLSNNSNNNIVKEVLSSTFHFIDQENENNVDILLLFIFPIFSEKLNKDQIFKEFFCLISKSQKEENYEKYKIPSKYSFDESGKKNDQRRRKIQEWIYNPLMMQMKRFKEIISIYISTILLGYSLVFKDYFKENKEDLLYEDIRSVIILKFKANNMKSFLDSILKEFEAKVLENSYKYDIDYEDMFFSFDDFIYYFEDKDYVFNFMKLRLKFFDFVK